MKLNHLFISFFFITYLFSSFVQGIFSSDLIYDYGVNLYLLPKVFYDIATNIRFIYFLLSLILFLNFSYKRNEINFLKPLIYFYLVLFIESLIYNQEIIRYGILFLLISTLPLTWGRIISIYQLERVIRVLKLLTIILIFTSLIINANFLFSGIRFMGIFSNPNTFAVVGCFWLSILLIKDEKFKYRKFEMIFVFVLIFLIFMTGSRSGFILSILIIFITFYNQISTQVKFIVLSFPLIYILIDKLRPIINRYNISYITESDSGRFELWAEVLNNLGSNFLFGKGYHAGEQLLGITNFHNIFINFLFSIGLLPTIVLIVLYIIFIRNLIKITKSEKYRSILALFIAYGLFNITEDLFNGIGSSIFMFFAFHLSLCIPLVNEFNSKSSSNLL